MLNGKQNPKYVKLWEKDHPHRHTQRNKEYSRNLRLKAIAALGGKCVRCGISEPKILEIDHIIPLREGHRRMKNDDLCRRIIYEDLKENLQLLCANCHRLKTWDEGWS